MALSNFDPRRAVPSLFILVLGGCSAETETLHTALAPADGLPCDVREVLVDRCQTCHGDPVAFGAPMSLAAHGDFTGAAVSDPTRDMSDVVVERITAKGARRMPPASQPQLSGAELKTLKKWLEDGAPRSSHACEAGTSGPDGGVAPAPKGQKVTCYRLTAHAPMKKKKPYAVGLARDEYVNFHFAAPWKGDAYARQFKPIVDNAKALHHWLLFKNEGQEMDGAVEPSTGTHPNAELVFGWAPGGEPLDFYATGDVALTLEGKNSYTLELHYNSEDEEAVDASGVEVCVSEESPDQYAAQAWLGTDVVIGTSATGTCTPTSDEPIHILAVSPHMHLKGTHMKATILRADGSEEILHDEPFDFSYQTLYEKDVWVMPGDEIKTECTYSEFALFGEGTDDEMCYLYTMHTPAGALTDDGAVGRGLHGDNVCLGF